MGSKNRVKHNPLDDLTEWEYRKLVAKAFPKLYRSIIVRRDCYAHIFLVALRHYTARKILDSGLFTSEAAYRWARDVGDHKVMSKYVTDPYWAYNWVLRIGNSKAMRERVIGSPLEYNLR